MMFGTRCCNRGLRPGDRAPAAAAAVDDDDDRLVVIAIVAVAKSIAGK